MRWKELQANGMCSGKKKVGNASLRGSRESLRQPSYKKLDVCWIGAIRSAVLHGLPLQSKQRLSNESLKLMREQIEQIRIPETWTLLFLCVMSQKCIITPTQFLSLHLLCDIAFGSKVSIVL